MTPERSSLLDEIRAKAMSDAGISDKEMTTFQKRQAELMQIAERDGGPSAIRAAMQPLPQTQGPQAQAPQMQPRPQMPPPQAQAPQMPPPQAQNPQMPPALPAAMQGLNRPPMMGGGAQPMPQRPLVPPQGVPPQGVPPQGVPPQGVPPQGVPAQQDQAGMVARLLQSLTGGGSFGSNPGPTNGPMMGRR